MPEDEQELVDELYNEIAISIETLVDEKLAGRGVNIGTEVRERLGEQFRFWE